MQSRAVAAVASLLRGKAKCKFSQMRERQRQFFLFSTHWNIAKYMFANSENAARPNRLIVVMVLKCSVIVICDIEIVLERSWRSAKQTRGAAPGAECQIALIILNASAMLSWTLRWEYIWFNYCRPQGKAHGCIYCLSVNGLIVVKEGRMGKMFVRQVEVVW